MGKAGKLTQFRGDGLDRLITPLIQERDDMVENGGVFLREADGLRLGLVEMARQRLAEKIDPFEQRLVDGEGLGVGIHAHVDGDEGRIIAAVR